MQRVRIGLTGLAFVFILVLLGAVFSRASDEEPITPNMIDQQLAAPGTPTAAREAEAEAAPQEPLAQLGVAPGNADNNNADPEGQPSAPAE